jgi:hypothetical protein
VVFAGHFEPDGRGDILEYLLQHGIQVRIFGARWGELPRTSIIRRQHIQPVLGEKYVQTIAGAKVALVFLSQANRDTYTRRCFEIPACRTLMIAPRTDDLKALFKEDEEAVYFSSKEELLCKVRFYLENDSARERIAQAGYRRCLQDGHSNIDRAKQVLAAIQLNRPDARFARSDLCEEATCGMTL